MKKAVGRVDLVDFATFANCFGLNAPNENCATNEFINADLDRSGGVNLLDFATLSLNFTG